MVDMVDMVDMGNQCFFSSVSSSSWVIKVITSSVLQAASARGISRRGAPKAACLPSVLQLVILAHTSWLS